MAEDNSDKLQELNEQLKSFEHERIELYLDSDVARVWELTNRVIPDLEREIAALTGAPPPAATVSDPTDFSRIEIKILEPPKSRFHWLPGHRSHVQVALAFSDVQRTVAQNLLEHVVFYQAHQSKPVKVSDLLSGLWISDGMNAPDAATTAENADEGITDLRLILQEHTRHAP